MGYLDGEVEDWIERNRLSNRQPVNEDDARRSRLPICSPPRNGMGGKYS